MTQEALLRLLNELSLDEKVGQLCQIDMSTFLADAGSPTGPMAEFHLTREQIVCAGSLICGGNADAEEFARVQEIIRREAPHGIPPLIMSDVIHGMRTIFPVPLALGCTFDEAQAERMGRVSAVEAAASGIHVTFAPMADVARDPRWGRCMESLGESPALCGAMSAAMVRGLHGDGLAKKDTLAACAKHFAGYALVEAGREYAPVDVSRTELFNTYLPPFKAALDAGCDMVMPAFTPIDRVPAVANRWLMNGVLRGQWGWQGAVISDWGSTGELVVHGLAANLRDASKLSFDASMDMDMMSFAYISELKGLVTDGAIPMEALDAAVMRILTLKNELGLFENPVKQASSEEQRRLCHLREHREAALNAALRSCVLLKNDGVLPLQSGVKAALTGDHADSHELLGGWAADGRNEETASLRQAFARERRVTLCDVEEADVILYAVGERQEDVGEARSKAAPTLVEEQLSALRQLRTLGKPIVLVLFCGRPLIIHDALPLCDAVLNAWFPGSEGAEAIRRLLMGDEAPSGHLSMTIPRSVGQIPIHHDALSTGRPDRHDGNSFVSRYLDESNEPEFHFGFGLSYTRFAVGPVTVERELLTEDAPVRVDVPVKNVGAWEGETVIQLYARLRQAPTMSPLRRLVKWQRVRLAPGEERTVSLTLIARDVAIFDGDGRVLPLCGVCDLAAGEDSAAPFCASVRLSIKSTN